MNFLRSKFIYHNYIYKKVICKIKQRIKKQLKLFSQFTIKKICMHSTQVVLDWRCDHFSQSLDHNATIVLVIKQYLGLLDASLKLPALRFSTLIHQAVFDCIRSYFLHHLQIIIMCYYLQCLALDVSPCFTPIFAFRALNAYSQFDHRSMHCQFGPLRYLPWASLYLA